MTQPKDTIQETALPAAYDGNPVLIDVFPWLQHLLAFDGKSTIVGPYRVAQALCKHFWPAFIPMAAHPEVFNVAVPLLSNFLGKQVITTPRGCDIFQSARAWISLGVDHTCPFLPKDGPEYIAILHDCMSYRGRYGSEAIARFALGCRANHTFLYVSQHSRDAYLGLCKENHWKIVANLLPFPNCHQFENRAWIGLRKHKRKPKSALSVSSVFPYKNVLRSVEVGTMLLRDHSHIGAIFDMTLEEKSEWEYMLSNRMFSYIGPVPDDLLYKGYANAEAFICCSTDEGFSLPPMEAMLLGVPTIILSDIPVHRENYGMYNVNFVSTQRGDMNFPTDSKLKRITEQDRELIYAHHTHDRMMAALKLHLSQ